MLVVQWEWRDYLQPDGTTLVSYLSLFIFLVCEMVL